MRYGELEDEARHEASRSEALSQYRGELGNRDNKIGEAFESFGPGSEKWRSMERHVINANSDCESKALALSRATDAKHISKWASSILFVGLCIFETPVNKFMFDILLALANWESYVISFAISFGLLYLAHVAGFQVRQIRGEYEDKLYFSKIAVSLFIISFLTLAVAILTICRSYASTVALSEASFDIFSKVVAQVKHLGPWATLMLALEDKSAVMLAAFNFTGLVCAFFLSFITHDSDAVYEASLKQEEKDQNKFNRLAAKYQKTVSQIGKRHAPRISRYATAFSSHNAKVIACKRMRGAELSELDLLDITGLDSKLAEARRGIGERAKIAAQDKSRLMSTDANVSPISFVERKSA